MMIVPIITYSGTVKLDFNKTQSNKFKSIECRAKLLTNNAEVKSIEGLLKKQSCVIVRQCLDKNTCSNFSDYFKLQKHRISTRNNNVMIKLPKVNLEVIRQSFHYQGAKKYNELPLVIRKEENFSKFKELLKNHFT